MLAFEYKEFEISDDDNGVFKTVVCEIELQMDEPAQREIPASMSDPGEPGFPATFMIDEVHLISKEPIFCDKYNTEALTLTETEFITFFSGAQDVVNNALEWASEQEIEYD
jgi:hypothetical protein